jgi:hypothetical protein
MLKRPTIKVIGVKITKASCTAIPAPAHISMAKTIDK